MFDCSDPNITLSQKVVQVGAIAGMRCFLEVDVGTDAFGRFSIDRDPKVMGVGWRRDEKQGKRCQATSASSVQGNFRGADSKVGVS